MQRYTILAMAECAFGQIFNNSFSKLLFEIGLVMKLGCSHFFHMFT